MEKSKAFTGSVFCIVSACLWGISGATGQYLFRTTGVSPEWLVTMRMFCSGIVLLLFMHFKNGDILQIWKEKRDRIDLVLFAILGVLMSQYTYFATINLSNAATATVLQFQAPILIVIFIAFRMRKWPRKMEILAIAFALVGTFLLATHGNFRSLSISPMALTIGLISAAAMAFYTAFPTRLLMVYNTMYMVGWAMFVGGIAMNFVHPFWQIEGTWDGIGYFCLFFTTFCGTLIPCILFMMGVRQIGATKGSLLMSMEPLSSTVVSVIWLKTQLAWIDYIGFFFIIFTVFLLTGKSKAPAAVAEGATPLSKEEDNLPSL